MEIVSDIPADHSSMTKYSGLTDPGFISVSNTLLRWMRTIEPKVEEGTLNRSSLQDMLLFSRIAPMLTLAYFSSFSYY
jgi:hypothetical protein